MIAKHNFLGHVVNTDTAAAGCVTHTVRVQKYDTAARRLRQRAQCAGQGVICVRVATDGVGQHKRGIHRAGHAVSNHNFEHVDGDVPDHADYEFFIRRHGRRHKQTKRRFDFGAYNGHHCCQRHNAEFGKTWSTEH